MSSERKMDKDLCRICGCADGIQCDIFGTSKNYSILIHALLPIVVLQEDPLSKVICHRCTYKLNEFSKFRKDSLKTEDLLKNRLPWMSGRPVPPSKGNPIGEAPPMVEINMNSLDHTSILYSKFVSSDNTNNNNNNCVPQEVEDVYVESVSKNQYLPEDQDDAIFTNNDHQTSSINSSGSRAQSPEIVFVNCMDDAPEMKRIKIATPDSEILSQTTLTENDDSQLDCNSSLESVTKGSKKLSVPHKVTNVTNLQQPMGHKMNLNNKMSLDIRNQNMNPELPSQVHTTPTTSFSNQLHSVNSNGIESSVTQSDSILENCDNSNTEHNLQQTITFTVTKLPGVGSIYTCNMCARTYITETSAHNHSCDGM